MSYDLFFRPRSADSSVSREDFSRYFGGRDHYELKESQAWYSNPDTGVYFVFEYMEPDGVDTDEETGCPVTFNLNYFRPHSFGLEAEPEVAAFVREFDLLVSDPQASGMGDGEYSSEGFLRGWNEGNAFGYRTILSQDSPEQRLTLPSSRIRRIWRWNLTRNERQAEVGDAAFIPCIFFCDVNGEVKTWVAWGDGLPILLPSVDFVVVPRDQFAPRGWFRSKPDEVLFTWDQLDPIVRRFPSRTGELTAYELFYEAIPADIEQIIRQKPPKSEPLKGVYFDVVLDRELMDEARSRLSSEQ